MAYMRIKPEVYRPRLADAQLAFKLETFGATVIVGPKWCGKSTTAERQAKSVLMLHDPDLRATYLENAAVKPSLLLKGERPRLLDEWQDVPALWDAVRLTVDAERGQGLFILTGSVSFNPQKVRHTGTGRISRLKMLPMSLFESGESNGKVSLRALFDNPDLDIDGIRSELSLEEIVFALCRGGWPASLDLRTDASRLAVAKDYVANLCESDISKVDDVQRNPALARAILRSYARNLSTLADTASIRKDVLATVESLSPTTLDSYLNAFRKLFVVEDADAWCPSIRSATAVRAAKKRELVDPSIAVAALGLAPAVLLADLKTFGFFFENLVVRDLLAYSSALGGTVSHYRDRYGLEADVVLHLEDGRYVLVEVKLGGSKIEEGATHLVQLRDLIREHNCHEEQVPLREPDLLLILTGTDMAYTRPDGVKVIPIGCLRD